MATVRRVDLVIFGDPFNEGDILTGIREYAQQYGPWQFGLHLIGELDIQLALSRILETRADGVICIAYVLDALLDRGFDRPFVALGAMGRMDAPQVMVDDLAVGRLGAEHLLERGIENFAFLGRCDSWSVARERGFTQRLKEAGHINVFTGDSHPLPDWAHVNDPAYIDQFLRALPPHVGVMTCQDRLANLLVDACEQRGLSVPTDVAVVSVDNNGLFCDFARTPFSSIDLDNRIFGLRAAALLEKVMSKGIAACQGEHVVIQPKSVVARRSTDLPLFRDPDLSRAIHFMRQHAAEGITVDDVLEAVPISRRSLEQRFVKAVGHSPAEELRHIRLEQACRLMTTTRMSLTDVALHSGFSNSGNFSRSFKTRYGTTPREYRQQKRR